jgi:transposase-like protein
MAISFKGAHFPQEVILMGVRWYVAYPLSTRHVEELMAERGVDVDHSTITGRGVSPAPASGMGQLADGRDIHQSQSAP